MKLIPTLSSILLLLLVMLAPADGAVLQDRVGDINVRFQAMDPTEESLDRTYLGTVSWSGISPPGYFEAGLRVTGARDFLVKDQDAWFAGVLFTYNAMPKKDWTPFVTLDVDTGMGQIRSTFPWAVSGEVGARLFFGDQIGLNLGIGYAEYLGKGDLPNEGAWLASVGVSFFLGGS